LRRIVRTTSISTEQPASSPGAVRVDIPGSNVAVGPVGYLQAERERLGGLSWDHFDVVGYSATVGAELVGLDLTRHLPALASSRCTRSYRPSTANPTSSSSPSRPRSVATKTDGITT
jgi:hypothetical protein